MSPTRRRRNSLILHAGSIVLISLLLVSLSSGGVYLALAYSNYSMTPSRLDRDGMNEIISGLQNVKSILSQSTEESLKSYSTYTMQENGEIVKILDEDSIRSGGGTSAVYNLKINIKGLDENYEIIVFSGFMVEKEDGYRGWTLTINREDAERLGAYTYEGLKDDDYIPYMIKLDKSVFGDNGVTIEGIDTNMYYTISIVPKEGVMTTYLKEFKVYYSLSEINSPERPFTIPITPEGLAYLSQKASWFENNGYQVLGIPNEYVKKHLFTPYIEIKSYPDIRDGFYGEINIAGLARKNLETTQGEVNIRERIESIRNDIIEKVISVLNDELQGVDSDTREEIIDEVTSKIKKLDLGAILGDKWVIESNLLYDSITLDIDIHVTGSYEKAVCNCIPIVENGTVVGYDCNWDVSRGNIGPKDDQVTQTIKREEGSPPYNGDNIGGYPTGYYDELAKEYWKDPLAEIVAELSHTQSIVVDHLYRADISGGDDGRGSEENSGAQVEEVEEEKEFAYQPYFISKEWVSSLIDVIGSNQGEDRPTGTTTSTTSSTAKHSRVIVMYSKTEGKGSDIPSETINFDEVKANEIWENSNEIDLDEVEETQKAEIVGWFTVGINLYSLPDFFENDIFEFKVKNNQLDAQAYSIGGVKEKGYYRVYKVRDNGDKSEWDSAISRTIEASAGSVPTDGSSCSKGSDPRYKVSVRVDVTFNPPFPQKFVYGARYQLYARQVQEPVITINGEIGRLEGKARVSGDMLLVPSMAPLLGNGLPDKVGTILDNLGVNNDLLRNVGCVFGLSDNCDSSSSLFTAIWPTYLPIPTPDKVALNRFAPGEYMGFYFMTNRIEDIIIPPIGIPIVTILLENWKVKYDGAGGVLSIDNENNIEIDNTRRYIKITTFGIGVGELLGRNIGRRLYIVPSQSFNAPQNYGRDSDTVTSILDVMSGFVQTFKDVVLGPLKNIKAFDSNIIESISDALGIITGEKGAYLQAFPYIDAVVQGDRKGIWPFVMFSEKTMDRFIIASPGVLDVDYSGSSIYLLHVRIVKVPGIGIPFPVVIPVKFEIDSKVKSVNIEVYKISIEPLLLIYDTVEFNSSKRYDLRGLLDYYLSNSTVDIYAVPVWVKERDGEAIPVGPVLLRGAYRVGAKRSSGVAFESSLALRLAYINEKYGNTTTFSLITVTDIGVPLGFLTVPYRDLYKLSSIEGGYLAVEPAWYVSGMIALDENRLTEGYRIDLASARIFNVFAYDDNLVLYAGVKIEESLLDKLGVKDVLDRLREQAADTRTKIDEIEKRVESKLSELEGFIETVDKVLGKATVEDPSQIFDDALNEIKQYVSATIRDLLEKITEEIIVGLGVKIGGTIASMMAIAVIPDPSGGILSSLVSAMVNELLDRMISFIDETIEGYLNQIFGEDNNRDTGNMIIERLLSYVIVQAVSFVGRDFVNNVIRDQVLGEAKSIVSDVSKTIKEYSSRIKSYLSAIILAMNNLEALSYYKPLLASRVYEFTGSGELVKPDTMLGGFLFNTQSEGYSYMMAVDVLKITDPSEEKLVLVQPYSAMMAGVSGIINGLFGGKVELPNVVVDVSGSLKYVSAWIRYLMDVKGNLTGKEVNSNIADKLLDISKSLEEVNAKIEDWVSVSSIHIDSILVPSYLYIPPTDVRVEANK